MRRFLFVVMFITALAVLCERPAFGQINCQASPSPCVTLTGKLASSNGLPAKNFTLTFQPSQTFFIAGSGVTVPASSSCSTSVDGSVVGIPDPISATTISPIFSGFLPAGTYYIRYTFYGATGETLASPEQTITLGAPGGLQVNAPGSGIPVGATGMKVYISTSSGVETLQGTTVGTAPYTNTVGLAGGSAIPTANTTTCQQVANDAGWPTGTGYAVSLFDASGNTYPGYPMRWQLMGPGTTINLSNGLPYYNGNVMFPTPVLTNPPGHATQSVHGTLDTEGYTVNGGAPLGQCIVGNGTKGVYQNCPGGGGSSITLKTNGTPNASQSILNLKAGSGVTLTDQGGGDVKIDAAGGGSVALQTNGTTNGSQTLLNLAAGSGINISDGGTGTVTVSATGGGSGGDYRINVTKAPYNCHGDWTTDDTACVNAAFAACKAITDSGLGIGTQIYFPAGKYNVGCSAPVTHNYQGCSIVGDGRTSTIIGPNPSTSGCIGNNAVWYHTAYPLTNTSGVTLLGTPLLTGATNSYWEGASGAGNIWINLRDSNTGAELNGLSQFTAEDTIYPTSLSFNSIIGKSAGAADSFVANNSAFELSFATNGALTGKLNVAGTVKTVTGSAGDIVANNQYHVALSYDGSTVRLFKNGTLVGSTAASGTVTQDLTEDVHFPGCDPSNHLFGIGGCNNGSYREMQGKHQGIRLSNTARYTANFTPPTAVFSPDANTLIACNFVTNYGIGTKCNVGASGFAYLPIHYQDCPAGVSMSTIKGVNMLGGVLINNGIGTDIINDWFSGNQNTGLYIDGFCNFEIHLEDLWVGTGGGGQRNGLAVGTGIVKADRISVNFGKYPLVTTSDSIWHNVFFGVSNDAIQPMTVVGIPGSYNSFDGIDLNFDYENPSTTLRGMLVLDQIPYARIGSSFFDLHQGPSTAYPVIVNNAQTANGVIFEANRFDPYATTAYEVKFNSLGTASVMVPWSDPMVFMHNTYTPSGNSPVPPLTDAPAYIADEKMSRGTFGAIPNTIIKPNDGTTGTYPLTPTSLTASGAAIATAPGATTGIIGITQLNAYIPGGANQALISGTTGLSGNVDVAYTGEMWALFDGATTAGHYAQMSSTQNALHDTGSTTIPASGWYAYIEDTTTQPTFTNDFVTQATTGGTLPDATTYHYCLTYITFGGGETACGNDLTFTTGSSGSNTNKVSFAYPGSFSPWFVGAAGFRVYVAQAGQPVSTATLQPVNATTCTAANNIARSPLTGCVTGMTLTTIDNAGAVRPTSNTAGRAAKIIVSK